MNQTSADTKFRMVYGNGKARAARQGEVIPWFCVS